MNLDTAKIQTFLMTIPPFDRLPAARVADVARQLIPRELAKDSIIKFDRHEPRSLYVFYKGAVSLITDEKKLLGKLSETDICNMDGKVGPGEEYNMQVDEDAVVYTLSCDLLSEILKDHKDALAFINQAAPERLGQLISNRQDDVSQMHSLVRSAVSEVLISPAMSVAKDVSIRQAAINMTDKKVSSLLVVENDKLVGIVTDKDIRRRCVAANLSPELPVEKIMSTDIITIPSETNAYDAYMMMSRKNIHNLPVVDAGKIQGIVGIKDLSHMQGQNSAYMTTKIRKATSIEELADRSKDISRLQVQLVNMGATSQHVGEGISAITSAITRRLIQMAEEKLGPAPVPYAWVAAGSQARREQTSHSDQDNGLIISDDMAPGDEVWFQELAKFVCDGLNTCGYIYCPGNVMAMNDEWRQTQSVWAGYFRKWITTPEPMALMYCSIFFDLRTIYGENKLLEELQTQNLNRTPKSTLFLSHLVGNALKLPPPLGFFRNFVLVHDGKHDDTLDLKHSGVAPIVDLARIYSLSEGIPCVNTIERLKQASGTPSLSREAAENLLDALDFINSLRLQHQVNQIQNDISPDNYMSPVEISKLEREHLKDAFKVIQTMQASLHSRY
jgi:CBS domain-containing protein